MCKILAFLCLLLGAVFTAYAQPTNLDFSAGNISGWTIEKANNLDSYLMSVSAYSPSTEYSVVTQAGANEINNIPLSMTSPLGGNFVRIGKTKYGLNTYKFSQTYYVDSTSQSLLLSYALVLQDGGHICQEQPYFNIGLKDSTGNYILGTNSQTIIGGGNCLNGNMSFLSDSVYKYKNWSNFAINLSSYIGKKITIELMVAGCSITQGDHAGYVYFDAALCQNSFNQNFITINGVDHNLLFSTNNIEVCDEGLTSVIIPPGASNFLWNGGMINGLTTQSVSISQPGSYSVTFNKSTACSNLTTVNFTILPKPVIYVTGNPIQCQNQNANFTAGGMSLTNYTWTPLSSVTNSANANSSTFTVQADTSFVLRLTARAAGTCVNFVDYPVTIIPTPTLIVSGNTVVCSGNSTTLSVTGADTYTWTPFSFNDTIVVFPTSDVYYTVNGKFAGSSCITTKNILVKVNPPVTISYNKLRFCLGDSAVITGNGALTYTWSNGGGANTKVFKPTSTTTYTLMGLTTCGIKQTVFTVTVDPLPNIVATANATIICSSTSTVQLKATGGNSYLWSDGNTNSIYNITPTVSATYSVVGTNYLGCSNSSTVSFSVFPTPASSASIIVTPTILCLGQSSTLTATAANSYSWSTWSANGGFSTSQSVVITPTASNTYYFTDKDANGCESYSFFSIYVFSTTPTFSFASPSNTFCPGTSSATLQINGTWYYPYFCSQANTTFSVIGNANLIVNPIPSVQTIYTVTANNGCGIYSNTVMVTPPPSLPAISVIGPTVICKGSSAVFSATGANYYTLNGAFFTTTISVTPSVSTTYTLVSFGANSCSQTQTINLIVNQGVFVPISSYTICAGNQVNLFANSASSYTWSNGSNANNITVSPLASSVYTVVGFENGCIGSKTINVHVLASPILAVNNGTICSGDIFIIQPTGADFYNYSSGTSYNYPTANTTYSITGTNINGCLSNTICSVIVNALPNIAASNGSVCIGQSDSISPSGGSIYFYNSGTNIVNPIVNTTYTITGEGLNSCVNTATCHVTVDPTCQDVWPGDANSDGTADNLDVLELGLHYTQTGTPRASTSNNWQSYFSNNWTGTITNGKNLNHSDCNGDGIINDNDTLAIYNNYGLTHAFKTAQTNTINPQLSIVPDQTSLVKGTWGTASIYLGDATTNINNINGVAFTVDFDNTLIETNSIYIEYQNSFLDAGQNLHFRKLDFANGKIFTATTHTINNNVSGNGLIAKLHYQIKSSLTTDEILNIGLSQANQSNASGIIAPLTTGAGTLMVLGSSVGLQELNGNLISISPNPTNGSLTIKSKTELQKIEVVAITGQVLFSEIPINVSHTLHLDSFANGIYFVNLYQNNRIVKREKVLLNK